MRKLATGGMAEVYLAKVAGPGGFEKLVVLKQILPSLVDNDMYVKMFLAEARVAAQLDHPNIVHVFDFGEIEGTYFLTMEYIEGANLRQLLRWAIRSGNPISPALAARIVAQACEGLAYAHEFVPPGGGEVTRLVHRDVSPENIMLSRIGGVKMLDFGVAKVSTEDHRSKVGSLKGKIAYMPPEQIRGVNIDHRVDIYALGVVLYQTLSGKRPYGQATDVQLITAILQEEPTPLMKHRLDLPDELLAIVEKAMAKDPTKRYQTALEFRDALEKYIAHETQPISPSQVAILVTAYQAANPTQTSPSVSGLGSGPTSTPGPSANESGDHDQKSQGADRSAASAQKTDLSRRQVIDQMMAEAAKTDPRLKAVLAPHGAGGSGLPTVRAPSFSQLPAIIAPLAPDEPLAAPPLPSPTVSAPRPPRPTMQLQAVVTPHDAAAGPPQVRKWRSGAIAPEPIRQALREALRSDRSTYLLRKLPPVVGRLCDFSRTTPWSVGEALGGVLDAAALADDHAAVVRIIDRAEARPGRDGRFASLVVHELVNPLRMAWLVEKLRSGLPADSKNLRAWLCRLGAGAGVQLLAALEASDPGPVQDLFAEALSNALPHDPGLVIGRLESDVKLRDVAALCFALEKSQLAERSRVFQTLIGRRDPALQAEVLAGRARARGNDALVLIESALGDKSEEVRRRALELTGQIGGLKGFQLLERLMHEPSFEAKPQSERARFWSALLDCGADAGLALVEVQLSTKSSLLNKKKVVDAKLTVIEGLARSRTELARQVLERVAQDRSQGDEVQVAAKAALAGSRGSSGEHPLPDPRGPAERKNQLMARICLDLTMLARAATTVDVGGGMLDPAIEHFRDGIRQLIAVDGKVQMLVDPAPTVNNQAVSFGAFHEAVTPVMHAALQARDLKGVLVEAMVPMPEFRAFLLRAFDPDSKGERLPHLKGLNFAGHVLAPQTDPPLAQDTTGRAKELFATLVRWLHSQKEGLKRGQPLEPATADVMLDEWARLVFEGSTKFMGVVRWSTGDTGTLVHAVNTAAVAMGFARDIGLPRSALREACEVSLMLGLAEAVGPADKRPQPGEPTMEDERFHAAGLLITNRLNRLGTTSAVSAIEAGLPADPRGKGPGVVASIHALAKAFDSLTAGQGLAYGQALEAINGRLRARFSSDLIGLFTQWAFSQASA